jgi:crotonyl-CoA carboxylase/reductase
MYAWAIRRERHGEPETAMQVEVVPTWEIDSDEVLVLVMAAGVNYNGVWASLGIPILFRRTQERLPRCRL